MVRVHYSIVFIASLAVLGFAAPISRHIVPQVETDIDDIVRYIVVLDDALNAFPTSGGTIPEAFAIYNSATTVKSSLNKGATSNIGESDVEIIITTVQGLEPIVLTMLDTIIDKKAGFQALPAGGGVVNMVQKVLNDINLATVAYGTNLINIAPPEFKGKVQAIKARIDAGFSKAAAAYE